MESVYGPFEKKMVEGTRYFQDMRDRCAYVAITGQLPSHLRVEYTRLLVLMTDDAVLSSLDKRNGTCAVKPFPFRHLRIESHPMFLATRSYVDRGYKIKASRGFGTRRSYGKIFLYTERESGIFTHQITVKIDGAVKQGWW